MKKILLASTSKKKKTRLNRLLANAKMDYEIVLPEDLGIESLDVTEGDDVHKNASLKAKAYFGLTNLPIIGYDQALYIDQENINPAAVKRNALCGKDEKDLSKEEIYYKMTDFYKKIAANHGGEVEAYWVDAFTIIDPSGRKRTSAAKRQVLITSTSRGIRDFASPITDIYKVIPIGKYVADLTEEENFRYRLSYIQSALLKLL